MAPIEYRIDPKLRRCCWYIILFAPILMGVWYGVAQIAQIDGGAQGFASEALLAAPCCAALLRWRLRIDGQGLWRRLLFGWSFWSWQDLSSGRIQKLNPYTLFDPSRSWGRRTLRLGFMAETDLQEAMTCINLRYRLPPPPEIPDSLVISYGFRSKATLRENGIAINRRGRLAEYSWEQVRHVDITRLDPVRRDFSELWIVLPDQEVALDNSKYRWSGAAPEVVNEFLMRRAASEKFDVALPWAPLTKRRRIERKLRDAQNPYQRSSFCFVLFGPLLIASLVWMAFDHGLAPALSMAAVFALLLGPLWFLVHRIENKRIADWQRQWDAADANVADDLSFHRGDSPEMNEK